MLRTFIDVYTSYKSEFYSLILSKTYFVLKFDHSGFSLKSVGFEARFTPEGIMSWDMSIRVLSKSVFET